MTTDPTPSPRPAALVEAMALAIHTDLTKHKTFCDQEHIDMDRARHMPEIIRRQELALDAARTAGFVLIPRAELEEAADGLEAFGNAYYRPFATKLRQRSRG